MKIISKVLVIWLIASNLVFASGTKEQMIQATKMQDEAKYDKAIDLYTKVLTKDKKNIQALLGRGQCYLMTEQLANTIVDMNAYILIDSLNPDAYNTRGLAKLYSDSALYSIDDFNRAISLDSNFEQAYINRATFRMSILLDEIAELDLVKAIALNPKNPLSHNYYGFVLHRLQRYAPAIEQYNIAISLGNTSADMFLKRGNSFSKLKKYKEAIDDYTYSLKLDSTLVEALNNRSYVYNQMGNQELAAQDKITIDRINSSKLNAMGDGVDVSKLQFFAHPSGMFSIEMPAEFNNYAYSDSFAIVQYVTKEKIDANNNSFTVGVVIEEIADTKTKIGMSEPSDLYGYCKSLMSDAIKGVFKSQPFFEKQKTLSNGASYQMYKFSLQYTSDSPEVVMYIVGFIRDNSLITLRFVYPEELSLKYDPIVLNAVKTFIYK